MMSAFQSHCLLFMGYECSCVYDQPIMQFLHVLCMTLLSGYTSSKHLLYPSVKSGMCPHEVRQHRRSFGAVA